MPPARGQLEDLIDLADAKQLVLASVTGDADLGTDNGRLFARIKGAVGKSEVERKTARQKRAARQRAESGKAWTPCRWFGYTMPNPDGTGVKIVKPEAKLLRKAYTDVLAGRSLMGIARGWNAKGVTTVRGNPWKATVLRGVLINARNAGIREYRGDRGDGRVAGDRHRRRLPGCEGDSYRPGANP